MKTYRIIFAVLLAASSWAMEEDDSKGASKTLDTVYKRLQAYADAKKQAIKAVCGLTVLDTGYLYDYDPGEQCRNEMDKKIEKNLRRYSDHYTRVQKDPPPPDIALSLSIGLQRYQKGFCMSNEFNTKAYGLGFLQSDSTEFGDWSCKEEWDWGGNIRCCTKKDQPRE